MWQRFFNSGILTFVREMIKNPTRVGAIWPSSKQLAAAMAKQIPKRSGLIIELGAGTGVVTAAILAAGFSADDIIVVERSEKLAAHLKNRFPQLKIIQGDAQELSQLIKTAEPINCIVSSLPLRSLPNEIVDSISKQLITLLKPGHHFIQFTYSITDHPGHQIRHLIRIHSQKIWFNLPPARVDVFEYTDEVT